MITPGQKIENISFRVGVITCLALVAFFFLMKLIGLVHILELRVLNLGILLYGIIFSIKHFKKSNPLKMTYLKGIGIGLLTSIISVGLFAIFILFYTLMINPSFMEVIRANESFGIHLNPFIISFAIFIEGTASGFLSTYAVMQYMKSSRLSINYDSAV